MLVMLRVAVPALVTAKVRLDDVFTSTPPYTRSPLNAMAGVPLVETTVAGAVARKLQKPPARAKMPAVEDGSLEAHWPNVPEGEISSGEVAPPPPATTNQGTEKLWAWRAGGAPASRIAPSIRPM